MTVLTKFGSSNKKAGISASFRNLSAAALGAGMLLAGSVAQAAPLNLEKQFPDILSGNLNFSYDATTDIWQMTEGGGTFQLALSADGPTYIVDSPEYDLLAQIDDTGTLVNPATLSIVGGIDELGIPDGSTLVTASLDMFGFAQVNPFVTLIEFSGLITGTHTEFQNNTIFYDELGVIFTAFTTDGMGNNQPSPSPLFSADFQGTGNADNFKNDAPVPGVAVLMAVGGLALVGSQRRKKTNKAA